MELSVTYFDTIPNDYWYEIIKHLSLENIYYLDEVLPLNYKTIFRLWYHEYIRDLVKIKSHFMDKYEIDLDWKKLFFIFEQYLGRKSPSLFDTKNSFYYEDNIFLSIVYIHHEHIDLYKYLIDTHDVNKNTIYESVEDPIENIWVYLYFLLMDSSKTISLDEFINTFIVDLTTIEDIKFIINYLERKDYDILFSLNFDWDLLKNKKINESNFYKLFMYFAEIFPDEFLNSDIDEDLLRIGMIFSITQLIEYVINKDLEHDDNFYKDILYRIDHIADIAGNKNFNTKIFLIIYDYFINTCKKNKLIIKFKKYMIEALTFNSITDIYTELLTKSNLDEIFYVELINKIIINHERYDFVSDKTIKILIEYLIQNKKISDYTINKLRNIINEY